MDREIDILVNNVGGRRVDLPTEDLPLEEWQKLLRSEPDERARLLPEDRQADARPPPRVDHQRHEHRGAVAIKGIRGRHYETAKAALAGLTRCLAADWAPQGVRVNAIAPGGFLTEPESRWFARSPSFATTFEAQIPMGRLGEPDELGPAALFLASDATSYVTGATLVVDGGYLCW